MDWLEYHSPMVIDWPRRCMQIEFGGYTISLQGISPQESNCSLLSSLQMASLEKNAAIAFTVQLCYIEDDAC